MAIPVAVRSKVRVDGRSLAEFVGSNPAGAWTFVCYECCVLSGRGFCDELITRPEESYRLWCVVLCDLQTSRVRRPWRALGRSATGKKRVCYIIRLKFPAINNNNMADVRIWGGCH